MKGISVNLYFFFRTWPWFPNKKHIFSYFFDTNEWNKQKYVRKKAKRKPLTIISILKCHCREHQCVILVSWSPRNLVVCCYNESARKLPSAGWSLESRKLPMRVRCSTRAECSRMHFHFLLTSFCLAEVQTGAVFILALKHTTARLMKHKAYCAYMVFGLIRGRGAALRIWPVLWFPFFPCCSLHTHKHANIKRAPELANNEKNPQQTNTSFFSCIGWI